MDTIRLHYPWNDITLPGTHLVRFGRNFLVIWININFITYAFCLRFYLCLSNVREILSFRFLKIYWWVLYL